MYADKHVGLVAVGNVGTLVQGDEDVGLARIDHLHVGAVLLHIAAEGQGHVQVDGLLLGIFAQRTGILAAVAGIDHQRIFLGCGLTNDHTNDH